MALVEALTRTRRLREDAAIGLVFGKEQKLATFDPGLAVLLGAAASWRATASACG